MKLKRVLIFCFLSTLLSLHGYAQDVTISGKVLDENNLPIPGATILLKGTTVATSSGSDGSYQIKATANGVLTISFMNYATIHESINNRTRVEVRLTPQSKDLSEVVVVGYGSQKKSVVTGSISGVKASDLEDLPITRVEQSLQGRVSGLTVAANAGQPGSSSTIRVRGITTFGNNEPLWVVDGVIVDSGGIGYLNQSDIESMEVLKDAASQAIYGARSAAGVILVTTKKGKLGTLKVSYNGYAGTSAAAKKLDLLNATQYATLANEASVAGGGSLKFLNPQDLGVGTDWQSAIFNNSAKRFGHEFSISGGNDISTFYLSFGTLDQEGIVATDISRYNRKNIRLNSTHKLSKFISVGQTFAYSREVSMGIGTNNIFGGPLSSAINLDPITPLVITDPIVANASPYTNPGIWRDAQGNPYGISTIVGQEMTNPLAFIKTQMGNSSMGENFVGNTHAEVEPIKGLKFRSTLGAKLAYWGGDWFSPVSYLSAVVTTPQNSISRNSNKGFGWNIENTASYSKNIDVHNFSVLLGQGAYVDNITSGLNITKKDIPVTSYEEASFNYEVPKERVTSGAYTGSEHKVTSLFARLNYDYDEKYLFTGIVRRDGSSRFGSNNKYGTFSSFSLGWAVSKEKFWIENNVVNQLKFRGGYGVTGNDAIGDFRYLATVGTGRNYTIGNAGAVTIGNSPNAPSNPDLKWEQTSQTNIGFDAKIFQDFNLSFDWYNKKTTGILQDVPLPGYVGANGSPTGNIADMVNKGIDVEIGYRKKMGDFNLNANANVSYLKNEVTYLGRGIDFLSGGAGYQSSSYPITRTKVGETINSFYGFQTDGIFQNASEVQAYKGADGTLIQPDAVPGDFRWRDNDGDGKITEKDRAFLGSSIPKFTFGLTVNLSYKEFDLLVFAQGAAGNKIFQGLRRLDIGSANYQTKALDRWTGEGTSNTFPRLTTDDKNKNFNNPSDFYLEKGDYVRFKTIQLGYTVPHKLISRIGLSKLRVYATGENLITMTKYTGYDPEIGGGIMGIDNGYYPQARTYMIGLNVQF
ncbi:MAG: TonB-dependent receptor [Sphingobacteriaceae bacterium]|nr:TonB-dependent receptor [Sphingobacteriaceae bacterium]